MFSNTILFKINNLLKALLRSVRKRTEGYLRKQVPSTHFTEFFGPKQLGGDDENLISPLVTGKCAKRH